MSNSKRQMLTAVRVSLIDRSSASAEGASLDEKSRSCLRTQMPPLTVEVRGCDIVVISAETGHSVTYRRVDDSPMLVSLDSWRADPDRERAKFLAQAWKAAYSKAKALGWL